MDCAVVGVHDFEHQSYDLGDQVVVPGRQGMKEHTGKVNQNGQRDLGNSRLRKDHLQRQAIG